MKIETITVEIKIHNDGHAFILYPLYSNNRNGSDYTLTFGSINDIVRIVFLGLESMYHFVMFTCLITKERNIIKIRRVITFSLVNEDNKIIVCLN